jgi:parallel beta-helix repeat protein/predicted outer membrane repeat protein
MNKNKAIAIFLILFSILCSLSAVAASDLNSTDTIANDIAEESITETADFDEEQENVLYATDEEQENILDDGESGEWGTFSELRNILTTSGYQNVVLYKNYRCEGLKDAIVIDHTININGKGHTIDCAGKSNGFIFRDCAINLKNLRITGFAGTSSSSSYAISVESVTKYGIIDNCTFEGNSHSVLSFAKSDKCTISNCIFRNNSARGAEIFYGTGNNVMTGCIFENNGRFTSNEGYDTDKIISLKNEFLVENCIFENNVAKMGIVYFEDTMYRPCVKKCFFGAAQTDEDYGLIYCDGPNKIEESIFCTPDIKGNVKNGDKSVGLSYNLWLDGTKSNEIPERFVGSGYGYETRYEPFIVTGYETVRIYGPIFSRYIYVPTIPKEVRLGDTVELKIMFLKSDDTLLEMPQGKPVTFQVQFSDSNLNPTNITFTNKISTPFNYTALDGKEGTVSIFYNGALISSLKITHAGEYDSLTLLKHEISKASNEINLTHDYKFYSSLDDRNAITVDKDLTINGNGYTIDGCNGVNGIFNFAGGRNITVKNLNIVNVKETAIRSESSGNDQITFINCTFENTGEAINSNKITFISGCEFENIKSTAVKLYSTQSTANIIVNSTFENCKSKNDGGAGYINSKTVIRNSKFKNNYASNGGGLYIDAENCAVDNCEFIGNEADYVAGGAYFSSANCNLTNSAFINNSAASNAAFYLKTTPVTVENNTESNSTITSNSFTHLNEIMAQTGNVLILENDYKFKSKDDMNFADGISIKKDLIINGNGHAIDGADYASILIIDEETANVTFNNVNFVNALDYAAKIKNAKSVTFNNCTFYSSNHGYYNNEAVIFIDNDGGSVRDSVLINRCSFIDNDVDKMIYANSGTYVLTVKDSIFANPKSTYDVYIQRHNNNNLDYNWWGNTADNFNSTPKVNAQLNNWYFLNTTLKSNRATISLNNLYDDREKSIATVTDCSLADVAVELIGNDLVVNNHAIIKNGNLTVSYKTIKKPAYLTAVIYGFNYTANTTEKGQFDLLQELIDNAENFTLNMTQDYTITDGIDSIGGIVVNKDSLTIYGNGHTINGLGISKLLNIVGNNVKLINLNLINGYDPISQKSPIQWSGNYGTMENCTVSNNLAMNGGAITWTGPMGSINNSTFINNQANFYGGAIYFDEIRGGITNSKFIDNSASDGGAVYANQKYIHIDNCAFIKNDANNGAAVYVNGEKGKIHNSLFENNTASRSGGAIYWNYITGIVTTSNFTFNQAKSGGAIYWNHEYGKVSYCEFANNTATEDGGAICWNDDYGTVDSSYFENNTAGSYGGAIFWDYDYGKVIESVFIKNTANDGGAIYFREGFIFKSKNQTVENSTFQENRAENNGGAIYLAAKQSSIVNSSFIKNQATKGGAIYSSNEEETISKLVFISNTASDNGSAIYLEEISNPVNYCIFINNGGNIIYYDDTSWFSPTTLNADYNWWGNNITDFNQNFADVAEDVEINNWYVLNMTMADGIAHITLNNLYDKANSRIIIGQTCKLPQITLTLTNENIDVADNATLDENGIAEASYIPKATQTSLTAHFETAEITVNKAYIEGTVTIEDIDEFDYGNVTIEFSVVNPTTVEVIIKNEDNETVFSNITDKRILNPDLAAGTYTITVTNAGNDTVLLSNVTKTFTVNKLTPIINVVTNDVTYPGNIIVNITSDITGRYIVKIADQQMELNLTANITETVTFTGLAAKEYTINVTYAETENYTSATNDTVKVNILKVTPTITVKAENTTYPGDLIVNVTSNIDGKYTIKIGNKEQNINLTANVTKEVTFTELSASEYTINVTYAETENYTSATNDTIKVSIFKATPTITVKAENTTYPGDLIVNVTGDIDGKYTIKIGNKEQNINLTANVTKEVIFTELSANEYIINVTYDETENYTSATNDIIKVSILKATPTITVKAENTTYPGDVIIAINTDASGKYTITVGNQTKDETLTAGTNTITFTGVKVGNYTITVKYGETENYTGAMNDTVKVSVLKNETFEPEITAINTANETVITFTFPEDATGNVTVIVDGKQYNATVENGKAIVTMPLIPLDSTVDFEYTGDENYPAKSKETSIANVTAIIKATDMTRGYNSGVDYQVTVVDGNGNPMVKKQVIFIINGNKYNATTNDEGIAILNLKLAIGTHTVTAVNPLNNDNITKTVKITTRITGNKNVNTYYAKNYAYKLRIIGDDGQPVGSNVAVKVTVNGKAQTLKTDKNGYITLKFTKNYLPKTYTVTAEYKGIKVTNKVKVKQVLSLKKVKVKKSAKKLVVKATLKEGKKST